MSIQLHGDLAEVLKMFSNYIKKLLLKLFVSLDIFC